MRTQLDKERMIGNHTGISRDNSYANSACSPDSSFASVLEEIFPETKNEIEELRTHTNTSSFLPAFAVNSPFDLPDETQRFEPLIDPALSYISNILAEEDEHPDQPCMTINEYLAYHAAYQAKAQEVASLLEEDSPSLTLKVENQNFQSSHSPVISYAEDSYIHDPSISPAMNMSGILSPVEDELPSLSEFLFESATNELCSVDWLGRSMEQSFPNQKTNCRETSAAFHNESTTSKGNLCTVDDLGVRDILHRTHKGHKPDKVLKPRKERGCRRKSSGKTRTGREGEQELVDLNDMFLQSAQALGMNNMKRALEILKKIKQHVSPYGNGAERLGYYFAEALEARFSGTGWPLYLGLLRRRPSPAQVLRATSVYMRSCPFIKVSHYFINQTILDVAKGATKLDIMDLQIAGGFNYPSLIKALAERPGGPPFVRVIAIGFPHYSMMPDRTETILERVQKTGRQLSDFARKYRVPFEFVPWAGMRDNFVMQEFVSRDREKDDVLVIISAYLLRYVMDETLDSPSARLRMLKMGQSVNPNVYIQGIVTGAYNTPFFTRRFREALFHFESLFDVLDTFIGREDQDRLVFESEILGKAILNIVACEGMEVVERIDKYKHWQAISEEVGFQQLSLNEDIKKNVQALLQSWHKEYTISEDSQYMLMGWKGRMLHAMSTWRSASS